MNFPGRMRFVIDASVILKWFTQDKESDLEKSMKIREDYRKRKIDLLAPELLIFETTNVLRYKESLNDELILKAIASIYAMDILMPVNLQIMEKALKLARKYGITVYDSAYLSLAQFSGCYLITGDKKLFQKVKEIPGIIYIDDYDL